VIGRPAPAQLVHDRLVHLAHELGRPVVVDPRHRRVAPHAARVRTPIAVEDALVVLRRRERDGALAVAQGEQRQLLAVEELLQHHLRLAEALLGEEDVEGGARRPLVLGDDHALSRREHVGLEHGRVRRTGQVDHRLLAIPEEHV